MTKLITKNTNTLPHDDETAIVVDSLALLANGPKSSPTKGE